MSIEGVTVMFHSICDDLVILWILGTFLAVALLAVAVIFKLFGVLLLSWTAVLVPILVLWGLFTLVTRFKLR